MDVVVGLGSNQGDRAGALAAAALGLAGDCTVLAASALYETEAVGPPQPDYLNAALLVGTARTPEELLQLLLALESDQGRVRRERWGPRLIDLDVLFVPGLVRTAPELEVPHPRLLERRFALAPLLDVTPDARDPRTGEPLRDVLARLPPSRLVRLGGSEWASAALAVSCAAQRVV